MYRYVILNRYVCYVFMLFIHIGIINDTFLYIYIYFFGLVLLYLYIYIYIYVYIYIYSVYIDYILYIHLYD